MRTLKALSITPDVKDWLAHTRQPRILHVFEQACNLLNERTEVLSIVLPQIGKGPFNLVVEEIFPFLEDLNSRSPVVIRAKKLIVGNWTIDTAHPELWSPRPDWESLHARKDEISNQVTKLRIENYPTPGLNKSFITSAKAYPASISNSKLLIPNCQFLLSNFFYAIANADIPSSLELVSHLAGLGAGLTPSGDDHIMGAIYATWILHPHEFSSEFAPKIANTAAALTTSLSAAWLRSAGRGDAGAAWHAFFDALMVVEPTCVQDAMDHILSIGETSGADALAGFIGVFAKWSEVGKHMQ